MKKFTKIQVAVLFGGQSVEHDVSLTSAVGVLGNIDRNRFDVLPIKITRKGEWLLLPADFRPESSTELATAQGTRLLLDCGSGAGFIKQLQSDTRETLLQIDIVLPVLHGLMGEDGTVQGLLALAGIAWAGSGVAASAVGMDKILMKQIFFQNDLPGPDYIWFLRSNWENSSKEIINGVKQECGFPCFVKPANSGSSIGITKAGNQAELVKAVDLAARYDRKILVERSINARELECAVLGNDNPVASVVGEILPVNEFYDYEAKYIGNSGICIPADIPSDLAEEIRTMSIKAFEAIDCAGMARVDFLYDSDTGMLYLNEINTIPGFTPISMYPKLWAESGVSYPELITRLIHLGLERFREITKAEK